MGFSFKLLIICILIGISSSRFKENGRGNSSIELHLENIRNAKGQILVALFNSEKGFPDDPDQSFKSWKFENGKPMVLPDIPRGFYALSIVHDEDMNNQMTYSKFGLPNEGYWFSKVRLPIIKRPTFEKAKFEFGGTGNLLIKANLSYRISEK